MAEAEQPPDDKPYGEPGLAVYAMLQQKILYHYMAKELGRPPRAEEFSASFFEKGKHREYRIFFRRNMARINKAIRSGLLDVTVDTLVEEFFQKT